MQAPTAQARTAMCSASGDGSPADPPMRPPSSLRGIPPGSPTSEPTDSPHGIPTGSLHGKPASGLHRIPTGSLTGRPAGSLNDGIRSGSLNGAPASSVGSWQLSSGALEDTQRLRSGGSAAGVHRQLLQRQAGSGQVLGQVPGLQLSRVIGRGSFGTVYEGASLRCVRADVCEDAACSGARHASAFPDSILSVVLEDAALSASRQTCFPRRLP